MHSWLVRFALLRLITARLFRRYLATERLNTSEEHNDQPSSQNNFIMIELLVQDLTWLNTADDSPEDTCAHGKIRLTVNGVELVSPTEEWTVSAAAIYFLRTLESDHNQTNRVCDHLIPCCGHTMWDLDDGDDVTIMGCDCGIDFDVEHGATGETTITKNGHQFEVSFQHYSEAVYRFSSEVRSLYESSAPKIHECEHDRQGFEKFIAEWDRRHPRQITK